MSAAPPRFPARGRPGRKRLPLYRRSRKLPPCWRRVDDGRAVRPSYPLLWQWEMVLQARRIPYQSTRIGRSWHIFVPPVAEGAARAELAAYAAENVPRPRPQGPPLHSDGNWAVLFFLGLLCWHGVRMGWWGGPADAATAETWITAGALDALRCRADHQWYRAVTALTLHADSNHLLGNMAFGSLLLTLLCRRTGLGTGIFLTILGGAAGNICNALLRPTPFVSLGFSTALFAAVGALSGSLAVETHRVRGKPLAPLAAGAALLAMLGTEGERVDYAAHILGLLAGLVLGAAAQHWRQTRPLSGRTQWLPGLGALALIILCWLCALV